MKRLFWLAASTLFLAALVSAHQPKENKPKDSPWSVLGIQVTQPGGIFDFTSSLDGTSVTARLHLPERFIVGIDPAQSKIKITDDKNTDLLEKAPETHLHSIVEPDISGDGKQAVMTFRAARLPMKGAAKIRIKGNVAVMVGKDEKTIERKGVFLAQPVDLEIGTLRSAKSRPTKGVTPKDNFAFLVYNGTRPLKKLVVFNADDKEITYRHRSQYEPLPVAVKDIVRADWKDYRTYLHAASSLKVGVDRWTLRVTYFNTVEQIMVPIDLEVGLGF